MRHKLKKIVMSIPHIFRSVHPITGNLIEPIIVDEAYYLNSNTRRTSEGECITHFYKYKFRNIIHDTFIHNSGRMMFIKELHKRNIYPNHIDRRKKSSRLFLNHKS